MSTSFEPRKVLLLEFNELTRVIMDPLIAQGKLPNFQRLFAEGATAAPESVDHPPHLDPWVTWVTLHTGVDRTVHGATVLEQDATTIKAKRTWHYAAEAGKSVGVFGSISAYPPRPVPGFMVPGPFAPSSDTYPPFLRPTQDLNRKYTQVHGKQAREDSPLQMASMAAELFKLGLTADTCATIAAQLVRERFDPNIRWRRVSMQPLVNYDFFAHLYRDYRPDYATWHTNHAAHYMHHYWRAYNDESFIKKSTPEEKAKYGGAIEYGYRLCDDLLGRFMQLVDDDTVICFATSMGQKPYVAEMFPDGRVVVRMKDPKRILDLVGAQGVAEIVPTMVPQWNVKIPDAKERARVMEMLHKAYVTNVERPNAFFVLETGDILTVTPAGIGKHTGEIRYFFPDAPKADSKGYLLEELFERDTPDKQGMHHPTGIFTMHGKGIKPGVEIKSTTNLDVAPTLLSLMGVPVPPAMKGRVMAEAWGEAPPPRSSSAGAHLS
jgi:Type I phosphodiesterase / nucleotide pyrophosphatase